jgi:hypothetical protein
MKGLFVCCKKILGLNVVVCVCNPSTWQVEAGRFEIQGHPGLHSETLSQDKKKKRQKKRKREKKENLWAEI